MQKEERIFLFTKNIPSRGKASFRVKSTMYLAHSHFIKPTVWAQNCPPSGVMEAFRALNDDGRPALITCEA